MLKKGHLIHASVANKATWGVSGGDPSWSGKLVDLAEGLASDITIIGVQSGTQEDGSATDDE
jgi:hypothetical protein